MAEINNSLFVLKLYDFVLKIFIINNYSFAYYQWEYAMADHKFDGTELRLRGSKIGYIDGNYIRDSHGSRVGQLDGRYIRDSHGSRVAEFDGHVIRDGHGNRIATIDDVKKQIDGVGGNSLVALWVLLVR